jgi:hypothetical protein
MHELGLDHVLRRVDAGSFPEIWALGHAGFELMDIGVTFGRRLTTQVEANTYDDLVVRPAERHDIEEIVSAMLDRPWGSRYESDPSYRPEDVRALRERWLWNSYAGRAQLVLVGEMESKAAGYVMAKSSWSARCLSSAAAESQRGSSSMRSPGSPPAPSM